MSIIMTIDNVYVRYHSRQISAPALWSQDAGSHKGKSLHLRSLYQAKVMKMLEMVSKRMVCMGLQEKT